MPTNCQPLSLLSLHERLSGFSQPGGNACRQAGRRQALVSPPATVPNACSAHSPTHVTTHHAIRREVTSVCLMFCCRVNRRLFISVQTISGNRIQHTASHIKPSARACTCSSSASVACSRFNTMPSQRAASLHTHSYHKMPATLVCLTLASFFLLVCLVLSVAHFSVFLFCPVHPPCLSHHKRAESSCPPPPMPAWAEGEAGGEERKSSKNATISHCPVPVNQTEEKERRQMPG